MLSQKSVFKGLKKLISGKSIISISGSSGTGKTSLAEYLIGNLLKESDGCCIWIQGSEVFPNKRFRSMFKNNLEKYDDIKGRIYITPSRGPCASYSEQQHILRRIVAKDSFNPPDLEYIVIDNISHHLRFHTANVNNMRLRSSILDEFYNSQLYPLIMFSQRNNVRLFLVHEMSYSPDLGKNLRFFEKMYKRIDSLDIVLEEDLYLNKKKMSINANDSSWNTYYSLKNDGFQWYQ